VRPETFRAWSTARFAIPLPEGHRFPAAKYGMIRDGVLARGLARVEEPDPADWPTLRMVHTPRYLDAMRDGTLTVAEVRRLGFPWSPALLERSLRTAQATVEAAEDALGAGAGLSLAGGTHHAHADHGEGYCCFNDVAIAVRTLQRAGRISRAVVIDLDVHQGNGTASIFSGDDSVFTFSMHGARNYPFHRVPGSLDVDLEDGTGDAEYLALLERHLGSVLDAAAADLAFFLAGSDPYAGDRLGRLNLSIEGLARRDRTVFSACQARGLPVVTVMAGGYARDLADLVTIHVNTVTELRRVFF
jgi:acetoin utilization deacetylase AcuC-like enzyme